MKRDLKKLTPKDEIEQCMTAYKWWEEEELPEGTFWRKIEHNGMQFPDEYTPHNVKMLYKGEPVDLTPAQVLYYNCQYYYVLLD